MSYYQDGPPSPSPLITTPRKFKSWEPVPLLGFVVTMVTTANWRGRSEWTVYCLRCAKMVHSSEHENTYHYASTSKPDVKARWHLKEKHPEDLPNERVQQVAVWVDKTRKKINDELDELLEKLKEPT